MYKNLPEVRKKRDEERRAAFYKTNRLRAQLYGKVGSIFLDVFIAILVYGKMGTFGDCNLVIGLCLR